VLSFLFLLCRTLDVLHVATAVELNCLRFVSADDRQLSLANAVGLTIIDIKR
jgi:predicted nucleic acid-binding protein